MDKKILKNGFKIFMALFLVSAFVMPAFADSKQQIKSKDAKGNTVYLQPNYENYTERNKEVSEKIVAIYDKRSPAYGYRYVLYTPIGQYVGHHRILQASPNGYGYAPVPDGGEGSQTPCFKTIQEAKHYYYPQWY